MFAPLTSDRRLDLLNAALSLQNEVDKKKRYKSKNSRGKATKAKAGRSAADSTYHFIAFVPVGRKVWQLDGLKTTPICIGKNPILRISPRSHT